jgi:membrane protease YdiL (CAAX protease family)
LESIWVLVGVLIIAAAFYLASLGIKHNYEKRVQSNLEQLGWKILFFASLVLGAFLAWTFSGPETQDDLFGNLVTAIGIVLIPLSFALFVRELMARDHQHAHEQDKESV